MTTLALKPPSSWKWTLGVFFVTSLVESLGMSQVFSFLPTDLGLLHISAVKLWVGVLSALTFFVGLPFVPLWGVWARRVGGKVIVIRSALVESLVFLLFAFGHNFITVFIAMACVGFQLGNTGIMLAAIRNQAPARKLGFAISFFSVSSPVGAAIGPLLGSVIVRYHVGTIYSLFYIDAIFSLVTVALLMLFYREPQLIQDASQPVSAWKDAIHGVRKTFGLSVCWWLFGLYALLMTGKQMISPFLPIAIVGTTPSQSGVVEIGVFMGLTACIGAIVTVAAGKIGDRIGYVRVLGLAFIMICVVSPLLSHAGNLYLYGLWVTVFSAGLSISSAMVFTLMSLRIPDTHRTTALNLIYLPLYFGGIIGPFLSSLLSSTSLFVQFLVAGGFFGVGVVLTFLFQRYGVSGKQTGQSGTALSTL